MTTDTLQAYLAAAASAKDRADKATPGPWHTSPCGAENCWCLCIGNKLGSDSMEHCVIQAGCVVAIDANFIASARTDIPQLADAVVELAAEVERLTVENKQLQENYEMAKRIIHSAGGISRECLP